MIRGQLRAVFDKELTDALRDRRALLSALAFPLLGPLLLGGMFTGMQHTLSSDGDDDLRLPVAGQAHAPGLLAYLRENGVVIIDAPDDPEQSVRRGDHDVILAIDAQYSDDFSTASGASVNLFVDRSRTTAAGVTRRVRRLVDTFGGRIGSFRLLARGISPQVLAPISVHEVDLATPRKHSANLLHMLGLFVILSMFVGGMQVAIDATAGERERGSLEALLLNPVPPLTLVVGKWLVALTFAVTSGALTLTLTAIIMPLVPIESLGLSFQIGFGDALAIAAVMLPFAPLAAASQVLVATFARSFKEAQTYLSLLLFVPMAPGLAAQVMGIRSAWWMMPVPALGQQVLIGDLLRGDTVSVTQVVVAGVSCGILAWVCLRATARLFAREGIIFAGQ